jgi:signal transduction histidine kinase
LQEHRLQVEMELPENLPQVMADEKQLTRVLSNLISNAVKFTPDGGHIRIAAARATTRQKQPALEITVSDSGCGVPEEQQKTLFDRYEQLPSATVYRKGTGLGLAICKEIVGLHNGDIAVRSPIADGAGSCFAFTLPLALP